MIFVKTTERILVSEVELAIYKKRKEDADIILVLYGFIYGFVMYLQMVNPTYLYGVLNKYMDIYYIYIFEGIVFAMMAMFLVSIVLYATNRNHDYTILKVAKGKYK